MTDSELVRKFYDLRKTNDVDGLRAMMADDVVWREPDVGDHMGELNGVEAVIDMMTRALAATGGTFSLQVAETLEIAGHCSAIIEWRADKGDQVLSGREMAVFSLKNGQIAFALFLPENISNDEAFWVT